MNTMDYDKFNEDQLLKIMKEIPTVLKKREKLAKKNLREQIQKLASEAGYSLDEVLSEVKDKPSKKALPKYRNPENNEATWTGRGRQPLWVVAALESGLTLEDLIIR